MTDNKIKRRDAEMTDPLKTEVDCDVA